MKISIKETSNIKITNNFNQKIVHYLFIVLIICAASQFTFAAGERLDTTFNAGVSDAPASVYISTTQSDGKVLVGGNFYFTNGIERKIFARLNSDGTLDNSFNTGGNGPSGGVLEIIILPGGKILIGGGFTTYNNVAKAGLARLNSDGSLDTTFNNNGTGIGSTDRINTISLQTDGKILISGNLTSYNGVSRFGVARVNANGTLDTSFTSGLTSNDFVEEVDVQTDGKILIGGYFSSYGGVTRNGVARLNSDGTLDASFVPATTTSAAVVAMTIQPDGKILLGGSTNGNINLIARLNTDGSADVTFTPPILEGYTTEYFAVQPDGKILIAGGYNTANSSQIIALLRLNANGTIDNSFNSSLTDYGTINAITQQTDGKILVGGVFQTANGMFSKNIARFNLDGTLDNSFIIGSGADNYYYRISTVQVITIQPDGKILVGGDFGSFNGTPHTDLVRLNSDGSVDTSFNVTDVVKVSFTSVNDIFIQPDGKILIGGRFRLGPKLFCD